MLDVLFALNSLAVNKGQKEVVLSRPASAHHYPESILEALSKSAMAAHKLNKVFLFDFSLGLCTELLQTLWLLLLPMYSIDCFM